MRRVIAIIVIALMMAGCASADTYDAARSLANFMEDHYGVTILIGVECKNIATVGFEIGDVPTGRSPLRAALGEADYEDEIKRIDDAFSIYPPGFFGQFACPESPNGLRILLADQIKTEHDAHIAGVTTIDDGYYNIFLGVGAFNELNVHHEIWHAMEYRVTAEHPEAFTDWNTLNPDDFSYLAEYGTLNLWEGLEELDDWFARAYGMVNEYEDRATIIEALLKQDKAWWEIRPRLMQKLEKMMTVIEPVFGENVYGGGE